MGYPVQHDGDPPTRTITKKMNEIQKKIGFWRQLHVSIFAHLCIINSLLTPSVWHTLDLCPLGQDTLPPIARELVDFANNSKRHYFSATIAMTARKYGSLGNINPSHIIVVMMSRTLARALYKASSPSISTNASEMLWKHW